MVGLKIIKRTIEGPFGKLIQPSASHPLGLSSFVNIWEVYEQEKKSLPKDLSPRDYTEAILEISNRLSL